ncbi:MAG: glycosyltransferase family 39 protein [Phycisphaerales bacterium]
MPHRAEPRLLWCLPLNTLLLVAAITIARLIYLAWLCPYNLVEDEAQYWVWSLRPDWSYYSKGPGIAWSILTSTRLFGISEFGVRVFAPLYLAVGALAAGGLAADASGDRRASFAGAALLLLLPVFALNGTFLMTIDGPMVAFWALACWAGFRALYRGSSRAWVVLGLSLGLGFLFKYTIALLLPSLLLAAVIDRKRLRVAKGLPLLMGTGLALMLLGLLPIAIWNQQNGWPAIAHFLGHANLPGGDRTQASGAMKYTPKWFFEFLGIQLAAIGPALGLMAVGLRTLPRVSEELKSATRFLGSMGLVTIGFYVLATFFTGVEANWTMGGYVSLTSLAGIVAARGMADWRERMKRWRALPEGQRPKEGVVLRRPETPVQILWHCSLAYCIAASVLMLRIDWLVKIPGVADRVAVHRLFGAPALAGAVGEIQKQRTDSQGRPPLVSYHYGVASQLTFYLPGHPMVFVAGSHLGYRRTQWDLWPDMSLAQPSLKGGSAVLVGGSESQWKTLFGKVTDLGHLPQDLRKDRWVYFGEDFLGPPEKR